MTRDLLARFRTPSHPAPSWEDAPAGAVVLHFAAVPTRLRTLAFGIAGVTLLAGLLVAGLAIALSPSDGRVARMVIFASALLLCLPLLWLVTAPFRARTRPYSLTMDRESLVLESADDGTAVRVRYDELSEFLWCTGSEYARLVIIAPGLRLSLLAGMARPLPGHRPDLPALPAHLSQALRDAGLTEKAVPRYSRYRSASARAGSRR